MKIRDNMKNQKGFTLVELMVVIAILGILAAIAVPKLTTANDSARGARIVADLRTIDTAIEIAVANGEFDIATEAPASLTTTTPANVVKYLNGAPIPPVGTYLTPSTATPTTAASGYAINAAGRAVLGAGDSTLTATVLTTPH